MPKGKNTLARFDAFLLTATERVVKRFNWLTGKDNFFLAQILNQAGAGLPLALAFVGIMCKSVLLLVPAICSPWFFHMRAAIRTWEEEREAEQRRGAKNADLDEEFRISRLSGIATVVLTVLFFSFSSNVFDLQFGLKLLFKGTVIAWPIMNTCIFYIVSVDKPPFARSQAWELFKSCFTVRELAPVTAIRRPSR